MPGNRNTRRRKNKAKTRSGKDTTKTKQIPHKDKDKTQQMDAQEDIEGGRSCQRRTVARVRVRVQ